MERRPHERSPGHCLNLNNYFDTASNIQYQHGTTHTNGDDADTITVVINDNGNTGTGGGTDQTLGSVNVDITAVNDAPLVGTNTGTTVAEGGSVTITTAMLNEADVDDAGAGLTYTVTSSPTNGQLELTTGPGVAITSFTQDDIDNNRVIFVHDGTQAAADSFDFSLADGGEDGSTPATGTFNFTVTNVNDAPVLTVSAIDVNFTEQSPVGIDVGATISDVDDTDLEGAIIRISNNYETGVDELAFTNQNGITGVWDSGSGTLTLSGTASVADYQTALRSIVFHNNSDAPSTLTRTVEWTVNDGNVDSVAVTRDILVSAVNDTPVASAPGTLGATEQTSLDLTGAGYSISDSDSASSDVTVTLDVGEGNLSGSAGDSGVVIGGSNSSTVTLTGTVAEINDLLAGTSTGTLSYLNSSNDPSASTTLTFTVNDGGNTGSDPGLTGDGSSEEDEATTTINITPVNDAPFTGTSTASSSEDATSISITLGGSDLDGTIEHFVLSSLPANGTLYTDAGLTNAAATATDIAASGGTLTLYFVPNTDWNGVTTFDYAAKDDLGLVDPTDATATITVNAVNDAPTIATNGTLNVTEGDTGTVITNSLLNEGDVDDSGTEITYRVTSVTTNGTLRLNGTALNNNDTFTQDDIDNNRLTYDHDGSETSADSFTFDVLDGGEDGAAPLLNQTFNISIAADNDAPTLVNNAITLDEADEVTLTSTILSATDSDNVDANLTFTMNNVSGGHFAYASNVQAPITSFTQAEITAGDVVFVHDGGEAAPSYDVEVSDGALSDTGSAAVTFTNVNDAPQIKLLGGSTVTAPNDGSVISLDPGTDALILDSESPANYDGGSITISGNGFDSADMLGLDTGGIVTLPSGLVDGGAVQVSGVQIGTIAVGVSNDSIVIDLNANATKADVEAVLREMTFESSSSTLGSRTVDIQFNDGDGTLNGGDETSSVETVTISVADAAGGLVALDEDGTYVFGSSDFEFTGVTGTDLVSITITSLPSDGVLELNGSVVSIGDTITKAELDNGDLEFVPVADENGLPYASFDFYVNLGNSQLTILGGEVNDFTPGGLYFTETNSILGDTSNFGVGGTVPVTLSIEPTTTNIDAAYLAKGEILFNGFVADHSILTDPNGYSPTELSAIDTWVQNGGILISTSDANSYDDINDFYGLTTVNTGNVTWHVDNAAHPIMDGPFGQVGNNGDPFQATGAIGYFDGSSLAVGDVVIARDGVNNQPTMVLRSHGSGYILFTADEGIFRANMTGGGSVSTANDILTANVFAWAAEQVSVNPAEHQTLSISVNPVNDAPVLTATGPSLTGLNEDATTNGGQTVASILGSNVSDVDAGAVEGIAMTGRGASSGDWEYSIDGGTNWIDFGTVSDSQSLLLRANDLVRFVPDGENGEVTSFDFRAWDQTAGTEGTKVDSTTNGGTSEFSAVEDTASITVSDVNDAPVLTATSPSLPTITEDDVNNGGIGIATLLGANVSDVDAGAIEGVAVTSLVSGNGTWQFSTDGGTSWSDVGAVSETSALLLTSSDAIRFVPDGENGTSPSFDFRAWDQSSGSGGAKVDVSTNGGTTAFSSVSDTASVTVTDVNDAPVLTATGPSLNPITEDALTNSGQTVASILGTNVSDVDSGAVEGIAITGRGASSGNWEYSIDGGTNWIDFGTVSDSQSLLLRANDLVRFVPDGENGEVTSFDFRAWDQTAGTEGTKVDSTTNGGT